MNGQPREASRRLFVAIELPETWKQSLASLQRDMQNSLADDPKTNGVRVRWVPPEGIHLTLKFLGQVPAERVQSIDEALRRAVPDTPGIELMLGRVGSFSDRRAPRIIWAAIVQDEGRGKELPRLVERLETWLQASGFAREKRGFTPHLTLARLPEGLAAPAREAVAAVTNAFHVAKMPPFRPEVVSLMQSHLGPVGARYECLRTYPK
jgi:2'-5' RNA ligase